MVASEVHNSEVTRSKPKLDGLTGQDEQDMEIFMNPAKYL